MKTIYIYNGSGAGDYSVAHCMNFIQQTASIKHYVIKFISASEVKKGLWQKDAALFIMPGGATVPFNKALNPEGNEHIQYFVQQGGCYLGICAGAYYGCSRTLFATGHPTDELDILEPLKFFPGTAIGPAYHALEYVYDSQQGAHAAEIEWVDACKTKPFHKQCFFSYHNGGCRFEITKKIPTNVKILARYKDIKDNPPAIIECNVGKHGGIAILSGVHLETPAIHCENSTIRQHVADTALTRKDILKTLLRKLVVHFNNKNNQTKQRTFDTC